MNNPLLDLNIWQQRWLGMKHEMDGWLNQRSVEGEQFERQDTLTSLMACLQAFGDSQMNFFLKGLADDTKYRLEPSAEYPWEYALRTTLDQIGYDLDVLLRAYAHRLPCLATQSMRDTLDLADHLAYQAIRPAIEHKLVEGDTAVITYFQKAVNVRLVPYAPVALVGIPYSAVSSPRDLLAIPHEVGHYVFRDGRIRSGRFADSRFSAALQSQFDHQPAWYNAWMEEIFADVYGCLIAGPVIALSFQDIVTDGPRSHFTEDDGEHPVSALRPAIYHGALRRIQGCEYTLKQLERQWQMWLLERGNPTTVALAGVDKPVSLEQAATEIDEKVVDLVLQEQFLGRLLPNNGAAPPEMWSEPLRYGETVDMLYKRFDEYVAATRRSEKAQTMPKLMRRADEPARLYLESPQATSSAKLQNLGATGLWIDAIKEAAEKTAQFDDPVFTVPPEIWTVLLNAGGWAVEGPGGANLHS